MFDFTSLFHAVNASRIIERHGKQILMALVGDSLLEVISSHELRCLFTSNVTSLSLASEFLADGIRCWPWFSRPVRYSVGYSEVRKTRTPAQGARRTREHLHAPLTEHTGEHEEQSSTVHDQSCHTVPTIEFQNLYHRRNPSSIRIGQYTDH